MNHRGSAEINSRVLLLHAMGHGNLKEEAKKEHGKEQGHKDQRRLHSLQELFGGPVSFPHHHRAAVAVGRGPGRPGLRSSSPLLQHARAGVRVVGPACVAGQRTAGSTDLGGSLPSPPRSAGHSRPRGDREGREGGEGREGRERGFAWIGRCGTGAKQKCGGALPAPRSGASAPSSGSPAGPGVSGSGVTSASAVSADAGDGEMLRSQLEGTARVNVAGNIVGEGPVCEPLAAAKCLRSLLAQGGVARKNSL